MATVSHIPREGQAIFVVREGEGDQARYAVCRRMTTVSGDHRLPGARQTVAEMVEEQRLLAGVIADDCDEFQTAMFWSQSGKNITININ